MDFDLGESAAALRVRLRALIADAHRGGLPRRVHRAIPPTSTSPSGSARPSPRRASSPSPGPPSTAAAGGSVWDQTVVREEMWAHHEPRGAQYMGLNWVGPAIMAFGTDAQKAAAPLGHRGGRRDLVPGLQRARGRLRPGLAAHPRRRGRRRLAHHRPEDLDLVRRHGAVVRARRPGRPRRAARGHHDVRRPDGHARHHRATDPVDARPPPPQRGVLRRRVGGARRRARRHRRGLGRHPQGARPRAGRHRALRPLRAAAVGARQGAGPPLGRPAGLAPHPVGTRAGAGAGGPPARLPHRARPGHRRVPRRRRLVGPHRGHAVRPGGGRGAVPGGGARGGRGRHQRARCTAPSRTTGATPRRPPWRPARSRCSG